jgi:hypothetical protein
MTNRFETEFFLENSVSVWVYPKSLVFDALQGEGKKPSFQEKTRFRGRVGEHKTKTPRMGEFAAFRQRRKLYLAAH